VSAVINALAYNTAVLLIAIKGVLVNDAGILLQNSQLRFKVRRKVKVLEPTRVELLPLYRRAPRLA
jgi:hypothetical protein